MFGELFLAELVEDVELARESVVVEEPDARELHANNDLPVWDHHRHRPEVDLQVLRQLLASRVPGVLQKKGVSSLS